MLLKMMVLSVKNNENFSINKCVCYSSTQKRHCSLQRPFLIDSNSLHYAQLR